MIFSKRTIVIVFMCLCVSICTDAYSRTLTSSYNPGCETQNQNCSTLYPSPHLLYTKGVSNSDGSDVIHFVVSGGGQLGPLSVLLIHAKGENSQLKFNWSKLLSSNSTYRQDAIQLDSGNAVYQAGFVITKLWEYNDTDDSANMTNVPLNRTLYNEWDTSKFEWMIKSLDNAEKEHTIELVTNRTLDHVPLPNEDMEDIYYSNDSTTVSPNTPTESPVPTSSPKPPSPSGIFKNGGKLQFTIVHSGDENRPDVQPRLEFTGNSTQLDFFLNDLASSFNGSRFGITIVQVTSLQRSGLMDVHITESVDDEFTPGIFKLYDWIAVPKTVDNTNNYRRSFLQWKPVCYLSSDRHLQMSQQMYNYQPEFIDVSDSDLLQRSIIYTLPKTLSMMDQNAMNISFGQSKDGFYKASNYITWTASMGLGKPPTDTISILVILIIAIGLGLPLILIIVGSIYICIRRRNVPTVTYETIN